MTVSRSDDTGRTEAATPGGTWLTLAVVLSFVGVVSGLLVILGVVSGALWGIIAGVALLGAVASALAAAASTRSAAAEISDEKDRAIQERDETRSRLEEAETSRRNAEDRLRNVKSGEGELEQEIQKLRHRAQEQERALGRERYLRARSQEAYKSMQSWSGELQRELMSIGSGTSALSDPKDVPSMVLRLARTVLEAEKGLLLSRPRDGSGEQLTVSSYEGFDGDPSDSDLVKRFADIALEHDRTVRETDPRDSGEARDVADSATDGEIENLVAIPIYVMGEFDGVVVCANREGGFDDFEDAVLLSIGDQAGAALQSARLQSELRDAYISTVGMVAAALEAKAPFTRGHSEDVVGISERVAESMGLDTDGRERVLFATLLRDLGKIAISERLLLKTGALDPEERTILEAHTKIGARIVERIPTLSDAAPVILHHHERHDGTGYPDGLSGGEIPFEARIVAVADAFAAMTTGRPYREKVGIDTALRELERCAGTQFDPDVVREFTAEVRRTPTSTDLSQLSQALNDPRIQLLRKGREPVLGHQTDITAGGGETKSPGGITDL